MFQESTKGEFFSHSLVRHSSIIILSIITLEKKKNGKESEIRLTLVHKYTPHTAPKNTITSSPSRHDYIRQVLRTR